MEKLAESSSSPKYRLKLLVDTKRQRVLFAEANKKAVDFLFQTMNLPLGEIVKLFTKHQIPVQGSLGKLYDSAETLNKTHRPDESKVKDLNPLENPSAETAQSALLIHPLGHDHDKKPTKVVYICGSSVCTRNSILTKGCFSDEPNVDCPNCKRPMSWSLRYVARPLQIMPPPAKSNKKQDCGKGSESVEEGLLPLAITDNKRQRSGEEDGIVEGGLPSVDNTNNKRQKCGEEGGFVEGVLNCYMVMDDLVVKPVSTVSSIALLNKLNVKEVGDLEEKEVDLGMYEALNLLRMSMESKFVLTNVFLKKKTVVKREIEH